MALAVTPLYAGLIGLLFVILSLRVIRFRRANRVSIGDGGSGDLATRVRVQGNFAEYAPFALVLMVICELQGVPAWVLHTMGLALLLGRVAHAVGLSQHPQITALRVGGMLLTFPVIIAGSLLAIGQALI